MKDLRFDGSFKRDLKRIARRGWSIEKLDNIVTLLRTASPLPSAARTHKLGGMYAGKWSATSSLIGCLSTISRRRYFGLLVLARTPIYLNKVYRLSNKENPHPSISGAGFLCYFLEKKLRNYLGDYSSGCFMR